MGHMLVGVASLSIVCFVVVGAVTALSLRNGQSPALVRATRALTPTEYTMLRIEMFRDAVAAPASGWGFYTNAKMSATRDDTALVRWIGRYLLSSTDADDAHVKQLRHTLRHCLQSENATLTRCLDGTSFLKNSAAIRHLKVKLLTLARTTVLGDDNLQTTASRFVSLVRSLDTPNVSGLRSLGISPDVRSVLTATLPTLWLNTMLATNGTADDLVNTLASDTKWVIKVQQTNPRINLGLLVRLYAKRLFNDLVYPDIWSW